MHSDFLVFKEEILYWLNKLGLRDYEVYIEKDTKTDMEAVSTCMVQHNASLVNFSFYDKYFRKEKFHHFFIRRYAFHEVVELLLSPVEDLITRTSYQEKARESAHRIIARLENSVFIDDYIRRFKKLPKDAHPV